MYGKPLPIVDALGAPAASTQTPTHTKSASFEYLTTRKDELVGWARKFSLFPYPFVTACCAMEFMAVSASRPVRPTCSWWSGRSRKSRHRFY